MEVLNEKPIAMFEVKAALKKIGKKEELNARANKVKEYLDLFAKVDDKKLDDLKKKLESLKISRLRDRHIVKIIDLMPRDIDGLKVVLVGENLTLKSDDLKKIVNAVNEIK